MTDNQPMRSLHTSQPLPTPPPLSSPPTPWLFLIFVLLPVFLPVLFLLLTTIYFLLIPFRATHFLPIVYAMGLPSSLCSSSSSSQCSLQHSHANLQASYRP